MRSIRMLFVVFGVAMLAAPLAAQSFWLPEGGKRTLSLESYKNDFAFDSKLTFPSSAHFITYIGRVAPRVRVHVELPLAFADLKSSAAGEFGGLGSDFNLGNLYLGAQIETGRFTFLEAGARAPLSSDSKLLAVAVGTVTDLDRLTAFTPDVATVGALFNYRRDFTRGPFVRLRAGPLLTVGTGSSNNAELFTEYAGRVGYRSRIIEVSGGLTGLLILTETGDLASRTAHQAGLNAALRLNRVRPGVSVLIPLDGLTSNLVNATYGLTLGIDL